ncbi:MotA/TolQ/ExbB proton channel family protein [Azonexus caeni]|uniref:MotA/TolQ/ExbB proton channel family protein n=1 Tax=Azonexus caeni TaxID=266126 RepID=UPI003A87ED04
MGIMHFWNQGDWVTHAIAILLAILSVLSWTIIGHRFFAQLRVNRSIERAFDAFWDAPNLAAGVDAIRQQDKSDIFAGMAQTAAQVMEVHERQKGHSIGGGVSNSETLTRALRNYMVHAQARNESGLTLLASVGSTAPFIGLFGTVWGIYHALVGLSGATQVVLDKVAGPVGEALIMTAAGLFVAIPAVLAYNALNRANRLVTAYLDGFAHDLHAYLTTGARYTLARVA